jgi:hypothetical protein
MWLEKSVPRFESTAVYMVLVGGPGPCIRPGARHIAAAHRWRFVLAALVPDCARWQAL